jgi:hypothetical protein
MALKFTYRPDGSIKSVISVNPDGTPKARSNTPLPLPDYMYGNGSMMLGTMPQTSSNFIPPGVMTERERSMLFGNNPLFTERINEIMAGVSESMQNNQQTDPITGGVGKRTFEDFVNQIKLNKEKFLENEGKFPGERGSGLKGFNAYIDQIQSGLVDKLSPQEAKFIDDLKNNRINF